MNDKRLGGIDFYMTTKETTHKSYGQTIEFEIEIANQSCNVVNVEFWRLNEKKRMIERERDGV